MSARTPPRTRSTSPLAGEVGARSAPGGGHSSSAGRASTPLPNPPSQGGREYAAARGAVSPRHGVGVIGETTRLRLAGFARTLRDNGFKVGLAETRDALNVLTQPIAARPSTLKPALRALFCATHSDWERFDEIFDAYWLGRGRRQARVLTGSPGTQVSPIKRVAEVAREHGRHGLPDHVDRRGDDGQADAQGRDMREGASRAENFASVDLRHIVDPAEIAEAEALAERLARVMRARLVRRERIGRRGRRLDLRRTIHRSVAHGGTPIDLAFRRRKDKPLRLVVLLDASVSMNLYTAFFVRFLHGIVDAFRDAEAFVFHTRLAHVSASLRDRDVSRAVDKLALMAQGIGGGTRIGESLATFNRWHARRVINSRTAVMIVSDGYDTGAPEQLAQEMRRLRRRCRRIVWLNPLIGWRDYSPSARGMQAALPYVDLFAPAHNLESLAALEPYLARI